MRLSPVISAVALATLVALPNALAAATQEFPFQLRDGLIWAEVRTAESSAPLCFLLDSGAGVSVIDLRTAASLGLPMGKPVRVQGVGCTTQGSWPLHLSPSAGEVALPR